MQIEVTGRKIAVDNEGFLLDPADWDLNVAEFLATEEQIKLSNDHWMVVNFVRNHLEECQTVPEARHALKAMKAALGEEKATRRYLYRLFPYGHGQQACKIAGSRKPLKLMLDI